MAGRFGTATRSQRGQAIPVMALVLWSVAAAALLVAMVGARAVSLARAQGAADATALSEAARSGSGASVAARNGVALDTLVTDGAEVDVVIGLGGVRAGARARAMRGSWVGLHPMLQAALRRAEAALGEPVIVVSGLRSRSEQEALWADRHSNPYPVAPPGTSLHERGLAVDVPLRQAASLATLEGITGMCQPLPLVDPVHFTLCRTTPTR